MSTLLDEKEFIAEDCPKCGAYAPIEIGHNNEGEWWEQYCDQCDYSDGDYL
jgi:Zn ribbon nucleic-acid-binding protein